LHERPAFIPEKTPVIVLPRVSDSPLSMILLQIIGAYGAVCKGFRIRYNDRVCRKTVVFVDSGKGGLPYFDFFRARNPDVNAVYAADTEHFPYGKKTKAELIAILTHFIETLNHRHSPALIALVCNAASVSALDELRAAFPGITFVGTVPAVKPAIENSVTGVVGVIGTERTIDDPYIDTIAAATGQRCRIERLAAPELVEFVEHRLETATARERAEMVLPYMRRLRAVNADGVALGCTHFLLLKTDFIEAGAPDIRVYDSVEGVTKRIERFL
jgi:glutamate racemase